LGIFDGLFSKKKPKTGGTYVPVYLRKVRGGSQIGDERVDNTNVDLTTLRYGTSAEENVRAYLNESPDVSHAKESIMRFAITDAFTVVAKSLEDGTIDPEATKVVQSFAARLNNLPSRVDGFSPQSTINAISESLVPQLLANGCCMAELVLDKALFPSSIQAISTNKLKYESSPAGDREIPYIQDVGDPIYLDSPAVYIVSLSQDPETPYSTSWFKAAIQAVIASAQFTNDLRRSFRKASLPRVDATIDEEKFKASLTPDVIYDQKKLKAAYDGFLSDLDDKLNGLNPEDAVVHFDIVKINHLAAGNISAHESVKTHADILNGQISAGLHVLPAVLGRGESQTTASTETVLFLKIVESLQGRLNELFSYLFTLAARLQGYDVTVSFAYKKPSLRPEVEEEGFLAMRQSRIREQWSDGLISDEEASIKLTGDLPSGNFTPKSGTGFAGGGATPVDNPFSNTSVGGKQLNNTKDQKDRNQGGTEPKTNKTTG
jgi:hypothetical protein